MTRNVIKPDNRAAWLAIRKPNINSTESAMLYGMSPYGTQYELWHRKTNNIDVEITPNERMEWGTDLQDAIAGNLARRYRVSIRKMGEYISLDHVRMGSSFDFEIMTPLQSDEDTMLQHLVREHGPGLLEIKNVDYIVFRDQWLNAEKEIEPPAHIDIQVQHQMHVSGHKWAAIGVLVGGNTGKLVIRTYDKEVGSAIERRIVSFFDGGEPDPVYPNDAAFVASLYQYAEPGKVFDGRSNSDLQTLCRLYKDAAAREKQAKEDKESMKAQALVIIGDAEKAILENFTISAGIVGPAHIEYDREAYRSWRVTENKVK